MNERMNNSSLRCINFVLAPMFIQMFVGGKKVTSKKVLVVRNGGAIKIRTNCLFVLCKEILL